MPSDEITRAKIDTSSDVEFGARLEIQYGVRPLKVYAVPLSELEGVGVFNTLVASSVGAICLILGLMFSIFWDMLISGEQATRAGIEFLVVLGVLCIGCFIVAYWAHRRRRSKLNDILDESRMINSN